MKYSYTTSKSHKNISLRLNIVRENKKNSFTSHMSLFIGLSNHGVPTADDKYLTKCFKLEKNKN